MSFMGNLLNLSWIGLEGVPEFIIEFFLWLDSNIYKLVGVLYEIFMDIAKAQIFDIENFSSIINRIYIILGVIVLFLVVASLIQGIVNPDKAAKSDNSVQKIVFKIVRALVLVCLIPTFFTFLYNFQNSLLEYNVLPRLLLSEDYVGFDTYTYEDTETGEVYEYTEEELIDATIFSAGNTFAWLTFNGVFKETVPGTTYNISDRVVGDTALGGLGAGIAGGVVAGGLAALICVVFPPATLGAVILTGAVSLGSGLLVKGAISDIPISYDSYTFEMLKAEVISTGQWDRVVALSEFVKSGEIEYTFILSTVAGIFLLYMIFSFCLDLAIRSAKLIFYQVMAPVSFFLSLAPGNNDLTKKWFTAVIATWGEVFVRVGCLCLVTLFVGMIDGIDFGDNTFIVKAIFVLGLIAFAKMIPKLIEDITGIKSGNLKLGIKDKLIAGGGLFAAGAAMTVGAGVLGTVRNVAKSRRAGNTFGQSIRSGLAGGASSAVRTAYNARGAKGFKDVTSAASKGLAGAAKARSDRISYRAKHGGTFTGAMQGHVGDFADWLTGKGVEDLDYVIKVSSDIGKANDDFRAAVKKEWDKHSTDAEIVAKMELKDFKGSPEDQQRLFDLYSQYRGQSASTIRQDIEQQREAHRKADYTALAKQQVGEMPPPPSRDKFKSSITGEIDENAYNNAVREYQNRAAERDKQVETLARRMSIEAAQRIGYLDSMYNQLEKESITRLGQVALSGEGLGTIKAGDLYSARTAGEYAQDVIRNSGIDLIDPSKDKSDPDYNVTVKNGNYAKFIDDVASAAGKQAVDANREKQRYLDRKSDK